MKNMENIRYITNEKSKNLWKTQKIKKNEKVETINYEKLKKF